MDRAALVAVVQAAQRALLQALLLLLLLLLEGQGDALAALRSAERRPSKRAARTRTRTIMATATEKGRGRAIWAAAAGGTGMGLQEQQMQRRWWCCQSCARSHGPLMQPPLPLLLPAAVLPAPLQLLQALLLVLAQAQQVRIGPPPL